VELLQQTEQSTVCPYKGFARYWSVQVRGADGHLVLTWRGTIRLPSPGSTPWPGESRSSTRPLTPSSTAFFRGGPALNGLMASAPTLVAVGAVSLKLHTGEDHSIVARAAT